MSVQVSTVATITGEAFARQSDGSLRSLVEGDFLLAGETLVVINGSQVSLNYDGGEFVVLNGPQELPINETQITSSVVDPTENTIIDPSVEAILAALEGDGDLLDDLEAPAAGTDGAPDGGGSSFIVLERISESVDSLSFQFDQRPVQPFTAPIGESISLPEEEVVQEVLDEDVIEEEPPVNEEPPVDEQPPIADPVLSFAEFFNENEPPNGVNTSPVLFRTFSVGGGVDQIDGVYETTPTLLEENPTLGGKDNVTSESNLVFTLTQLPNFGTLYIDVEGNGSFVEAALNTTFNTESKFFWAADAQSLVAAGEMINLSFKSLSDLQANEQYVQVYGYDFYGDKGNLTFQTPGMGVADSYNYQNEVPEQLAFRDGKSQMIIMDFKNPSIAAQVSINNLIAGGEKEIGVVEAYLNGESVGIWTFSGVAGAANLLVSGGSFSLPNDIVFDQLRFTATELAQGGSGNSVNDSSDYFIAGISFKELEPANFFYKVTDESGLHSEEVKVLINIPETESAMPPYAQPPSDNDNNDCLIFDYEHPGPFAISHFVLRLTDGDQTIIVKVEPPSDTFYNLNDPSLLQSISCLLGNEYFNYSIVDFGVMAGGGAVGGPGSGPTYVGSETFVADYKQVNFLSKSGDIDYVWTLNNDGSLTNKNPLPEQEGRISCGDLICNFDEIPLPGENQEGFNQPISQLPYVPEMFLVQEPTQIQSIIPE